MKKRQSLLNRLLLFFLPGKKKSVWLKSKMIRQEKEDKTKLLLEQLLEDKIVQSEQSLKWIEQSEKALKWASEFIWNPKKWTLIITAIGFLLIAISAFHVRKVATHISLSAHKIQLELATQYESQIVGKKRFVCFYLSTFTIRSARFCY